MEESANRAVLRLHTRLELTKRTILTFPPGAPDAPLDLLLMVPGIRSIDLHRYRARLNLEPDADPAAVAVAASGALMPAWGRALEMPVEPEPRAFAASVAPGRRVAESLEMAGDDRLLGALFRVHGVAEAIAEDERVTVRPGRLFSWERVEPGVLAVLADARSTPDQRGGGTPSGSPSG